MLLLLPHACDISKQRSCSTRVTNKSADHIGISNLIRGIIHEHLALKRGGNAAGKDRPELVCASRLICRLEDRSWKYCWKDSDLCGNLDTAVYSRKRRSSTTMQKQFYFNSTKESLSCNTKCPSDREDILWKPKFIRRLEDRSWKYCWKDSDLCGNLDTVVYSRKRRSSTTLQKTIFFNSTKESLSCNTKRPSDREDILWKPKFILGSTAPPVGQGLFIEAPRSRKG